MTTTDIYRRAWEAGFKDGVKAGIRAFAWWRDGKQYLGTCAWPLSRVLADIDNGIYPSPVEAERLMLVERKLEKK